MLYYKTRIYNSAQKDIRRIARFMRKYNSDKIVKVIYKDIESLKFMPRINKTLIYFKDKNGEYIRMISGKYSIIYKIKDKEIIILRIFNQKENYLNQRKFILREKIQKYVVIK